MQKKSHVLDLILFLAIIGMGILIYFRREHIINQFRPRVSQDPAEVSTDLAEMELSQQSEPEITNRILAPGFELESIDGKSIKLSDYLGKGIIVNFWTTWCPPCRDELPLFDDFAERFSDEIVILAINAGEEKNEVQNFLKAFDFEMIFLLDQTNATGNTYKVRGLPTTVFIDPEGYWQATHIGQLDKPLLESYLGKIGVIE